MFLQRYVHVVLDAVLGNYVKNIDPETLKISVWNGKVEIDVLELKTDAFPLPSEFKLVKGTLHQVRVDLPWSNLVNQPIRVDVQDVCLLLEVIDQPLRSVAPADATTVKQVSDTLKRKRATIDAIEKATELQNKNVADIKKNASKKGWSERLMFKLLLKLLDNMQLSVQHVHIRIEDTVSNQAQPYAVGLTLESMVIKTADERWNYAQLVVRTPESSSFIRKKIDINKCGVYWSLPLTPVPITAVEDGFAFLQLMQSNFWSPEVVARHSTFLRLFRHSDYVMEPLTLSIRLTVNDGQAKLPLTYPELSSRVMTRLGTPWMVDTITVIGEHEWQQFVAGMPPLVGDRMYTLGFVFTEAWSVAREMNEEEDVVPSVEQFEEALASCLQWSVRDVVRLRPRIIQYRDAVVQIMEEKCTYIDLSASIDRINVIVKRPQYLSVLSIASFLGTKRQQARYAHLRPVTCSVHEDPSRWWRYAIDAVLIDVRERLARVDWDKINMLQARRRRYQELYLCHILRIALPSPLISKAIEQLSRDEVIKELDILELDMDLQELIQLRMRAREKIRSLKEQQTSQPPETTKSEPPSSRLWGITSWFGGGGELASTGESSTTADIEWSDQDTQRLFDAIHFNPVDDMNEDEELASSGENSTQRRWHRERDSQHIWYRFHLGLARTSLELIDEHKTRVLSAVLTELDTTLLVRASSMEVGILLRNARFDSQHASGLRVERMPVDEIVAYHPLSVQEKMSCVRLRHCEHELPLIDVRVELKGNEKIQVHSSPPGSTTPSHSIVVSIVTQAIKVHVNMRTILQIACFFGRPQSVDLSGLEESAWRRAQSLQQYSSAQVRAALAKRSQVELLIDIISPVITVCQSQDPDKILILEQGPPDHVELAIFLGHLRASTSQDSSTRAVSVDHPVVNVDCLYDIIDVGLTGVEVRLNNLVDPDNPHHGVMKMSSSYLLEKTSLHLGFYISIARDDPSIPLIKLTGGVESVTMNLSIASYKALMSLLRSIGNDISIFHDAPLQEPPELMHTSEFEAMDPPVRFNIPLVRSMSLPEQSIYDVLAKAVEQTPTNAISDKDILKLWQRVLLMIRFHITEVVINLQLMKAELGVEGSLGTIREPWTGTKVFQVRIANIRTDMSTRMYDKLIEFTLGSFRIEEHWTPNEDVPMKRRFLITSEGDDNRLIQMGITSVNVTDAPRPSEHALWRYLRHDSVSRSVRHTVWQDPLLTGLSIDICLRSLTINLHQDAFTDLFLFFMGPRLTEKRRREGQEAAVFSNQRTDVNEKEKAAQSREPLYRDRTSEISRKLGSWVTSSFADKATSPAKPEAEGRHLPELNTRKRWSQVQPASFQLRLEVTGLSLILHSDSLNPQTDDTRFVRLVAHDFSCCMHFFPEYLSIYAHLMSMNICDMTVTDPNLCEIIGHGEQNSMASVTEDTEVPPLTSGYVPTVDDTLAVLNRVPAICSCALQFYGADRIHESWHPGFTNRYSVRLQSPRIRLLYCSLQDLRVYLFHGELLRTIIATLTQDQEQIKWDKDVLLSTIAPSTQTQATTLSMKSKNSASLQLLETTASDVVSMFPVIDLCVSDAVVYVPAHRTSVESLVIRFGELHVSNAFVLEKFSSITNEVMAKVLLNASLAQIRTELKTLRIMTVLFERSDISGLGFNGELITQSLLGACSLVFTSDFTGNESTILIFETSPLRLVCNRVQYAFLMCLPFQNIGESSHFAPQPKVIDTPSPLSTSADAIPVTKSEPPMSGSQSTQSDDEDKSEHEMLVTIQIPQILLELLHGIEGYQPSVTGDLIMAKQDKKAMGSICSIDIASSTISVSYGLTSGSIHASTQIKNMRIRDTRIHSRASISPSYRDVVVFVPGDQTHSPSILIQLLRSNGLSSDREKSVEWSCVSPHERRGSSGGNNGSGEAEQREQFSRRRLSESFTSFKVPTPGAGRRDSRRVSGDPRSVGSDKSNQATFSAMEMKTELVLDIEGFRVIPSNIHYDVLKFLERPAMSPRTNQHYRSKREVSPPGKTFIHQTSRNRTVFALTLGRSAILLVEDPSRPLSRAVMLSWEATLNADLIQNCTDDGGTGTTLHVGVEVTAIQATSRLSQDNMWSPRDDVSTATADTTIVAGDFLKPCNLHADVHLDFATGFMRLNSAFDRVLELRFGYLDVCSIRRALEQIIAPTADDVYIPSHPRRPDRRMSIESSLTSAASVFRGDDMIIKSSGTSLRTKKAESPVIYGTTLLYLVSATFRGSLNVRPAVGMYSSPWKKRYLVLPFTAQERQMVKTVVFRILPGCGSYRVIGDSVQFGDDVILQIVLKDEITHDDSEMLHVSKYDQLGASGYLGPDGSAGTFETRIWKHGSTAFNSDRNTVRHKDAIEFEGVTIYRAFTKGKSSNSVGRLVSITQSHLSQDPLENGSKTMHVNDGGGYLMFNGVGDAPIPFVVSVIGATPQEQGGDSVESTSDMSAKHTKPNSTLFWQKLKVFHFQLPGVNATVVNDFHNMLLPLIHLRVVQLRVDVRGVLDGNFTAMSGLQLGIQSYNAQLAVWEPLVEDFDVNVAVHAKGGVVCDCCLSDHELIPLSGVKLRCAGIPLCLFGTSKTAVFAAAASHSAETKHFIYHELLEQPRDEEDVRDGNTILVVVKKAISVNVSRNGVNVLLQFLDLVTRTNAEDDAWRERLGAYIYVDNQSGIPFLIAAQPTSQQPTVGGNYDEGSGTFMPFSSCNEQSLPSGSDKVHNAHSGLKEDSMWSHRGVCTMLQDVLSSNTKWLQAADGERIATRIVAHEAPAGYVTSPLRRLLWLKPKSSMVSSASSKAIPVPIGYSNRSYLHLESAAGYTESWHGESIICETVAEQGTLVMRLRSKVQLLNHLSVPVDVIYNDHERRTTLLPGARTPHFIPIQFLEDGKISFCPQLKNGQLQPSAALSIGTLVRHPNQPQVVDTSKSNKQTAGIELRKVLTFYWDRHPDSSLQPYHDSFGVARPPFQLILTVRRKSDKHETLVTISPPIRIENLLPYSLAFRMVCVKTGQDLMFVKDNAASFAGSSGCVLSGTATQVCELEITTRGLKAIGRIDPVDVPAPVALSVAIPECNYHTFSSLSHQSIVYGPTTATSPVSIILEPPLCENGDKPTSLRLLVELVRTERLVDTKLNALAPLTCRIYTEYWLIDRTCLSLQMCTADHKKITLKTREDTTTIALFSSNETCRDSEKIMVYLDGVGHHESEVFNISTVGLRGEINLCTTPTHRSTSNQYDVGVMIEQGPSLFARTTIVTFVPRYYFINNSDHFEIQVKQDGANDNSATVIRAQEGCFFHWSSADLPKRVQLRFVCHRTCTNSFVDDSEGELVQKENSFHGTSEWSLPFEVTSVGNFVVRIQRALVLASSYLPSCYRSCDSCEGGDCDVDDLAACELRAGRLLHVGVELHDPAFVIRFHEGDHTMLQHRVAAEDTESNTNFVPFRLTNDCTTFELVIWQKIEDTGGVIHFEGGDHVLPFHSAAFVPYAASTAPTLFVQVQSLLCDSSVTMDGEVDDDEQSYAKRCDVENSHKNIFTIESGVSRVVLTTFEVTMGKLYHLPLITMHDGKSKKRLWVEVKLEETTKTLYVTDVLPGVTSEHKRRRHATLLRRWKRYNASIRKNSQIVYSSRLFFGAHCFDGDEMHRTSTRDVDGRGRKTKHVRFADDEVAVTSPLSSSSLTSPRSTMSAGNREQNGPFWAIGAHIIQAMHLEDLYSSTNVHSAMPFLLVRLISTTETMSRKLRPQSQHAVFPRWFPRSNKHNVESTMITLVLPDRSHQERAGGETTEILEVEVREPGLFGSSVMGHSRISLSDYFDEMVDKISASNGTGCSTVTDVYVPIRKGITPSNPDTSEITSCSDRTVIHLQLVCAKSDVSTARAMEKAVNAIRQFDAEEQLDRLVRCKSQLKLILERESIDFSHGSEGQDITLQLPSNLRASDIESLGVSSPRDQDKTDRTYSISSHDDSTASSDTAPDEDEKLLEDERFLSVVVVGVSGVVLPHALNGDNIPTHDQQHLERKLYCTITYMNSTRSALASVAKPSANAFSNVPAESDNWASKLKRVRTHTFRVGENLGLDLIYQNGRVIVQAIANDGPCGQLLQQNKLCIGDTVVAVNDKSIVNLHRDASFRVIAQACRLQDTSVEEANEFTLSFLLQTPCRTDVVYEAEWNRRVEFLESNAYSKATINRVLVRVYLRNEASDHGLASSHELSVVPFLYFFGDDKMMDHLDHSKQDTRFDTLVGECWIPVPDMETAETESSRWNNWTNDATHAKDCVCALYAARADAFSQSMYSVYSNERTMVGQVHVALKWDHRGSMTQLKPLEKLLYYVQLEVAGAFVSVVDDGLSSWNGPSRQPREVLLISLSAKHADMGIQMSYGYVSDGRHVVNARVGHLQIDNQLLDTSYPVMMYPIRLADSALQEQVENGKVRDTLSDDVDRESNTETKKLSSESDKKMLLPTFQLMSVFFRRQNLVQFEYIFAQLQQLDVKVEDTLLVATAHALSGIQWSTYGGERNGTSLAGTRKDGTSKDSSVMELVDTRWPFPATPTFPVTMLRVEHRGDSTKVLLKWLLLCPIKLNITFTSTTDRSHLLSLVSPDMSSTLRTAISAAAALVSNLDHAAINVPEFYVENLLETMRTLVFYAIQHYVHHGLRSWYRIVGSVDFLGNPIGLVNALGTGVKDFFYTPAQMLLEDEDGLRIDNLKTGMTKGSKSLLRNTAVGIFHTTGKITETLGKGIALLAMDEQYNVNRQRQTNKQKNKINDLGGAIAEGGKGLVGGVWDGIKGVVAAPVRGAERDGAGGFVLGIGQGVAGLIVKPTAGFLDLLTNLSKGAKSSAEAIDGEGAEFLMITRVRLPRRICSDGVVVSYSEREARGCAIVALTGFDTTDEYVFHVDYGMESQRGMLLLTDKRVICLNAKSGQKLWEVALDSALQVHVQHKKLDIGQGSKNYSIECDSDQAAANFKLALTSARLDLSATRYLLLNLEQKAEENRSNALRGVENEGDEKQERVDISVLMGTLQDTLVTGLTKEDLQAQPLRSVHVELCHLENKDAAANVPTRAIDRILSFSVYQILVYGGPYQWTIYRRFTEFRELYASLERMGHAMDGLPPLPARTFLPSTRETVATFRHESLSIFLQAAIMHSSVSGSTPMLEFLTRGAQEVRVSLPPLSPSSSRIYTGVEAMMTYEDV